MPMRIIVAPDVKVIGSTEHYAHPTYKLPPHTNAMENVVAMGGKVCYDSYGEEGRSVEQHVNALVEQSHFSVLEHAVVSFLIQGISRACSHEIVRHRHFSYSQRSTRYTAEEDAAIVLEPYFASLYEREQSDPVDGLLLEEDRLLREVLDTARKDLHCYRVTVERLERLNPMALKGQSLRKWARGKARNSLPHSLETRMVMTGNLRAWRHFVLMRSNRGAEAEIRRLAQEIFLRVVAIAPEAFSDMRVGHTDGYIELTTTNEEAA
jgi:thymidylate synthase (FAD)